MRINGFDDNQSVGIDGIVYKGFDLSFLPENWEYFVYDDLGDKTLTFYNGTKEQLDEEFKQKILDLEKAEKQKLKEEDLKSLKEYEEEKRDFEYRQKGYTKSADGEWVKDYDVMWEIIKTQRNMVLAKTDVYMIEDFPIEEEEKKVVISLRQKLRDATKLIEDPFALVGGEKVISSLLTREEEELFYDLLYQE